MLKSCINTYSHTDIIYRRIQPLLLHIIQFDFSLLVYDIKIYNNIIIYYIIDVLCTYFRPHILVHRIQLITM